MKRSIIKVSVFLMLLIASVSLCPPAVAALAAEAPAGPQALSEFSDDFFAKKMSEYHVPGAAIVVVKDGKMIFSRGYGYADIEREIPVDPQKTIFRVASVSKIFTIAGVMQLAESGSIDIDEDVNAYLKGFQVENDYGEPIRVKHLLTHTDGFETRDLGTFVQSPGDLPSLENVLKNDLKSPVQAPGSKITYGGYGTALAGYLISQVKNESFEEYINNSIFKPLNMNNSTFYQVLPDSRKEDISTVYDFDADANEFFPTPFLYVSTAPTGALSTTPEDMGKFLIALLNGGQYGESRILREDTVEKMLSRQYAAHPSLPGVTYGFMEFSYNGQKGLVRDGSGVGIRSQIFLLPEHNMGYFYVQNTRGDEMVEAFNDAFMDRFFPDPDKETEPGKQTDPNALKRYEGIYRPSQTAEHTLVKTEALAMGKFGNKS